MSKIIDFPKNLTFKTDSKKSVFLKDLKRILTQLEISWRDECCGDEFITDCLCEGGGGAFDPCSVEGFIQPIYPNQMVENVFDEVSSLTASLGTYSTVINTSDGNPTMTLTIPDATQIGQLKKVVVIGSGSEANIHLDSPLEGTAKDDFVLHTNGGYMELIWGCNNAWILTDYVEDYEGNNSYP